MVAQPRTSRFHRQDKPRAWHTAFYYLAEHVRYLTDGQVNHKKLYALVSADQRFVNHPNPLVRKRTAADLSRAVHSKRYAEEMRRRLERDPSAFEKAAQVICKFAREGAHAEGESIGAYLSTECWPDVWSGLANERDEWRSSIDLGRIAREASLVFGEGDARGASPPSEPCTQLTAVFEFIANGHLDAERLSLVMGATGELSPVNARRDAAEAQGACLIKFFDGGESVAGFWVLPEDRPFSLGRLTDCDSVDPDASVSRLHACIRRDGAEWLFEDLQSKNGSTVVRGGEQVALGSRARRLRIALVDGDSIVLAGKARYRFCSFAGTWGTRFEKGDASWG